MASAPRRGDWVLQLSDSDADLVLSGRLTRAVLATPLIRGQFFIARRRRIVAVAECSTTELVRSVIDRRRRYQGDRNERARATRYPAYLHKLNRIVLVRPTIHLPSTAADTLLWRFPSSPRARSTATTCRPLPDAAHGMWPAVYLRPAPAEPIKLFDDGQNCIQGDEPLIAAPAATRAALTTVAGGAAAISEPSRSGAPVADLTSVGVVRKRPASTADLRSYFSTRKPPCTS